MGCILQIAEAETADGSNWTTGEGIDATYRCLFHIGYLRTRYPVLRYIEEADGQRLRPVYAYMLTSPRAPETSMSEVDRL